MKMRVMWVAITAAATMTMAGCGGSSTTEDAAGSTKTTEPAATAPAATTPATTVASTTAPAVSEPEITEPEVTETEVTKPSIGERVVDDTFPVLDTTPVVDYEFTGEGSGPFCDIVRELDSDDPIDSAFTTDDPVAAKAAWADVQSAFDRLEGVAPDEIRSDVSTLAGIFDSMQEFFAGFDFDMAAASVAMEDEPEMVALFTGEDSTAEDASNRLDAYGVQVCGLAS